jgi:hypothetical protein
MTSAPIEPSPFDDMDGDELPARPPRRLPTDPFLPLSPEELDRITKIEPSHRLLDPWRCVYNIADPEGKMSGWSESGARRASSIRQCPTRLADPTKSRYCISHAMELGVASYSPDEATAVIMAESTANLYRLVPKAVKTLETVMEDEEAPHGVRAKAADSILDRTGYNKGVDLHVETTLNVEDPLDKLRTKLTELREAQEDAARSLMGDIHDAVIVEEAVTIEAPSD